MDHTRNQLAVLAAAQDSVELDAMGYAATVTDQCRAYRALAADRNAVLRHEPELVRMTRDGSPGAIIYAALLLRDAGRDIAPLLAPHADDRRPLTVYPGGCQGITHWLCEAVRWAVNGESWSHPVRLLGHEIERLEHARWFELPSAELMRATAAGQRRDPSAAVGWWTINFAKLLETPNLASARARLDELLGHMNAAARIYAALLIRRFDRPSGARALAALAVAGGEVERLSPVVLQPDRTRRVPIADVVEELARWPSAAS